MEVEQLPGNSWTGCSARVSKHRLDTRAIPQETGSSAEAVPGICRDGVKSRPWDELKGQSYLGSDGFIEKHAASKDLREIPRLQLRAANPSLERIFAKGGTER
jgi:hypothetical protein